MKKVMFSAISLLLALLMLFSLAACDNNTEQETEASSSFNTTESVTEEKTEKKTEVQTEAVTETDKATETVSETDKATEPEKTTETETVQKEIAVTESGDTATVVYADGLSYEATGYGTVTEDAVFTANDGLTFTFRSGDRFECNRFLITYSSNAPMEIKITYKTKSGDGFTDNFFLEAAENAVFKGLLSGYLNSQYNGRIIKMTVDTCEDKTADFKLHSFTGDKIEVISGDICYIENNRFKLGIKLSWGGGINYVEDKTYKDVEGLQNLCNMHDTGRLIQQSYYGTGAIPGVYEAGSFDGSSSWPYNPVQGGDKYLNKSRLIDLEITEDHIYVKAQPQDWGKNNAITPSYMENVYSLTDDYIEVNNRFVDFSGWEHVVRGQELPAFYTVSYLDTYYFYNGVKPWTDDELTVKPDLPFWGSTGDPGQCNFFLREGNTETWSAWVNGETNWGIGLYTPNIDRLKAGRASYNGSMDPMANPTNYIACYNQIKLTAFLPIEYSYLMTTGTIEEIREVFKENKDFTDNASLNVNRISSRLPSSEFNYENLDFTDPDTYKVFFDFHNASASYDEEQKATVLTAIVGSDPYATLDYGASTEKLIAENYTKLIVEYMVPTTNGEKTSRCVPDFFLCTGELMGAKSTACYRPKSTWIIDGEWHTMEIPVSTLSYWSGNINRIRFDFFSNCSAGDKIYIKSIKLVK